MFAGLAAVPLFGADYYTGLATKVMILGMAALGLDALVGIGGMLSFGHAAYFGIGAYVGGVFGKAGVNEALIVWPTAILVAGLFAVAIGSLSLRTRGAAFIMITLAFAQMLFFIAASLPALGTSDGIGLPHRNSLGGLALDHARNFHYAVLLLLAGVLALTNFLAQTPFGRAVDGIRQNEPRMRALGYNPKTYQLACFTFGAAVTGLAGVLAANLSLFASPDNLHWMTSGTLLVMVILGGVGTLFGSVLGAAVLVILEEGLAELTEHWMVVLGPVLIAVVLFGGNGLAGILLGRSHARSP
jgi:branched-chain amino acid transport system permease protein